MLQVTHRRAVLCQLRCLPTANRNGCFGEWDSCLSQGLSEFPFVQRLVSRHFSCSPSSFP